MSENLKSQRERLDKVLAKRGIVLKRFSELSETEKQKLKKKAASLKPSNIFTDWNRAQEDVLRKREEALNLDKY